MRILVLKVVDTLSYGFVEELWKILCTLEDSEFWHQVVQAVNQISNVFF